LLLAHADLAHPCPPDCPKAKRVSGRKHIRRKLCPPGCTEHGTQMILLALTVVAAVLTVVPGRATLLQSGVHLSLLAAFLLLAASP
jgi:hypothetical protein